MKVPKKRIGNPGDKGPYCCWLVGVRAQEIAGVWVIAASHVHFVAADVVLVVFVFHNHICLRSKIKQSNIKFLEIKSVEVYLM